MLEAYAAGTLPAAEAAGIAAHLAGCERCSRLVRSRMSSTVMSPAGAVDSGPTAPSGPGWPDLPIGARLDRYTILARVGHGGMGVVYAAYDPRLDRKVALKVLRLREDLDAAEQRARLVREGQAMARLSHPNVIAVHDSGDVSGQAYIAMEFVDGGTLADWLERERRSWREIVGVFLEAGRGLEAAHRAGLVHRDFKPENVLVGKDGRIRVTDFGLARRDQSAPAVPDSLSGSAGDGLTQAGTVLGTPAYMAPEQLRGRAASPRTDVFSYCVALFEALHGVRPFAGTTLRELCHAMEAGRVEPARRADVPAWLTRAVLSGLAADPQKRPESIAAVAVLLERDPSRTRRRILGGSAVLGGVVALGVLLWSQAESQKDRCRRSAERLAGVWDPAVREAARAAFVAAGPSGAIAFEPVARTLDGYAAAWARSAVDACEATRVRGTQSDELLDLRMECLDDRLAELGSVAGVIGHPDGAMLEKAMGPVDTLAPLSDCADARRLRTSEARYPAAPAARARARETALLVQEASALLAAGRFPAAEEKATLAVDRARAADDLTRLADALYEKSIVAWNRGRATEARAGLEETLLVALRARRDDRAVYALCFGAFVASHLDRPADETLASLRLARALLPRLGDRADLEAFVLRTEGGVLSRAGRVAEAIADFRAAVDLAVKDDGLESPMVQEVRRSLGRELSRAGRKDEAAVVLRQVLETDERARGPDHPQTGSSAIMLAFTLRGMGRNAEALPLFERALAIREKAYGPKAAPVQEALAQLADGLGAVGRPADALPHLRRALALADELGDDAYVDAPSLLGQIADAEFNLGHLDAAIAAAEQAIAHPRFAKSESRGSIDSSLAYALWEQGRDRARAVKVARAGKAELARMPPGEFAIERKQLDAWLLAHDPAARTAKAPPRERTAPPEVPR